MSTLENQNLGDINEEAMKPADERTVLMERARMMGIEFSNNIGTDKLRQRIADKMDGKESSDEEDPQPAPQVNPLAGEVPGKPVRKRTLRQQLQEEQMKLMRIRVTCMNPNKSNLPGEIFTVANEYLGTVKKFVPFGEATDDGYHVPYCIYRMLVERKYLNIRTVKDRRTGIDRVESNWVREFSIELLPQLTKEELKKLGTAQIAAGSVE